MKVLTVFNPENIIPFRYAMSNNTFVNQSKGVFLVSPYCAVFLEEAEDGVVEYIMSDEAHTELVRSINEKRDPEAFHLFSGASEWHESQTLQQVVGQRVV